MDRKLGGLTAAVCISAAVAACQPMTAGSVSATEQRSTPAATQPREAHEGPFGLARGLSIDEVKVLIGAEPYSSHRSLYWFRTVPSPYPGFERYLLLVGEDQGLCKVVAVQSVTTNRYGTEARAKFTELATALTEKYGKPSTELDELYPQSMWDEPEDWMMGLLKKERVLATYWGKEGDPVAPTLESIELSATATSTDEVEIALSYDFDNVKQCVEAVQAEDKKAL